MLFIRKDFHIFSQSWLISHPHSNFSYPNSSEKKLYCYQHNICLTSKLPSQAHFLHTLNPIPQKKTLCLTLVCYFFPDIFKSFNKMLILYLYLHFLDNTWLSFTRNLYPSQKFRSPFFNPKLAFLISSTIDIVFWLSCSQWYPLPSFSSPFPSVSQPLPSVVTFLLC